MEYFCHIWAGSEKTSLSSLDVVQKCFRSLLGDKLLVIVAEGLRRWIVDREIDIAVTGWRPCVYVLALGESTLVNFVN